MKRKLIIDGNAVYEIDENCMLKNRLDKEKEKKDREKIRIGKSRALKNFPGRLPGRFCVQRQISIRIRYCCITSVVSESIAASSAEDQKKDDPQTAVIAASVTVAPSIATSATAQKQENDPDTGVPAKV